MDASTYGQLRVFHAIAAEGSISAAARRLEMAPPSVSHALKQLEQKIGVPLFSRTTRKIQLTQSGEHLLRRTRDALDSLQNALEAAQPDGQAPAGLVRITLSRFAYQLLLKPVLPEFRERYPHIQLEISLNDALADFVKDGFDLGVRFGNHLEDGMVARQLMRPFKEGIYVSRAYAEQHGVPQTPEALAHHPLIGYRFISSNRTRPLALNINGQTTTLDLPAPLLCNDPEIIADCTRMGLGIGRIFAVNMQALPDKAEFIPVLEAYWCDSPPLYLYYLQHSQRAKRVQTVIDFLLEKAAAGGWL